MLINDRGPIVPLVTDIWAYIRWKCEKVEDCIFGEFADPLPYRAVGGIRFDSRPTNPFGQSKYKSRATAY